MRQTTHSTPFAARVIERRPDGSALIEGPIAVVADSVDFSRTAGGGVKNGSIPRADLEQMVANFPRWPKPVGVGLDGVDGGHVEDRSGPQSAFVDGLRLVGDVLVGVIELGPAAAEYVVSQRAFRGFSMEAQLNASTPTVALEGWVLVGGTFTNNPAIPAQFRIAASDGAAHQRQFVVFDMDRHESPSKEDPMSDEKTASAAAKTDTVSLTFHETALQKARDEAAGKASEVSRLTDSNRSLTEQVQDLRTKLETAQSDVARLTDERSTAVARAGRLDMELKAARESFQAVSTELTETKTKLAEETNSNLGERVRRTIAEAIDAKIPPAVFDGHEADPAAWMSGRFVDFDQFSAHVQSLRSLVAASTGSAPVKSGHDPAKAREDDAVKLTDEERKVLEPVLAKHGGTTFLGVTTEAEARERARALASKKE